jgi:hypothetical protein
MRKLFRLGMLALAALGAKSLYDRYQASMGSGGGSTGGTTTGGATGGGAIDLSTSRPANQSGRDTPTGTDPDAKYSEPGYQDKSLGQAVQQDEQLVDRLLDETGGNVGAAESRFRAESAGAPALARQEGETGSST